MSAAGAGIAADRDRGRAYQRTAADPQVSSWASAHAGSGKTRVLTDRVLRLLLAGTRPGAILCITFTKAAAAEMAKRLHARMGEWAVVDDAELRGQLQDLLGRPVDDDELAPARRLFAGTIDAAGGLRIQTIHALCESLLKRFPLEAGVPPHFGVADEATAAELIDEARERLLGTAGGDGALAAALAFVVREVDELGFGKMMGELVQERRRLQAVLAAHGGVDGAIAALRRAQGLAPEATEAGLLADFAAAAPAGELRRAAAALGRGSEADRKRAAAIAAWLDAPDRAARVLDGWVELLLTQKGAPRAKLATKPVLDAEPAVADILAAEQQRLIALLESTRALRVAAATDAALRLGAALLGEYEREKAARALLDYDDLILKVRDLLQRPGVAPWVLYKLDGGLDHILVDEAQDTSPEQWQVIAALAEEFFAGSGARETARTVFAVGDEKQSIFSFQGADPDAFAGMRSHFERRVIEAGATWRPVPLELSFRSVPAVLDLVDAVFAAAEAAEGVCEPGRLRHFADRRDEGGLVELWPPVTPEPAAPAEPWDAPLDYVAGHSPPAVLAQRIAATIKGWLDNGERLESLDRPIAPGDVMVLVRRRDAFFEEMVRALKTAGVPVAGADRMVLAEQIAVMDLVALGQFVLMPDDELTLATVLKSPLYGFDDDDLFALCWQRRQRLWHELLARADERPKWRFAADELSTLRAQADFVPPYEFYAGLLGARGGRRRMLARLGREAIDPLDEFLAIALAFERHHAPGLQGFLHWFAAGGAIIKRDLEQGRDEVRVLTVHGAKGLEAPVVFLPDTCGKPGAHHDPVLFWSEAGRRPLLLWPVRADDGDALAGAARAKARAARDDEHRRLLYVALTRARDRLYVCGWQGKKRPAGSWYDLVAKAFDRLAGVQTVALPWEGTEGRRHVSPQRGAPERKPPTPEVTPLPLPAWASAAPPAEAAPARPLAPSRVAEAEPPPQSPLGPDDDAWRFARGRLIHRLLQSLPDLAPAERRAAAHRWLASPLHRLSEAAQAAIADEVMRVIEAPAFVAAFAPGSRAEVPIAGRVGGQLVAGQIDRLAVTAERVLVVDFKSNRPPPRTVAEVSPAYLRQMALYRAALQGIFPDKSIDCALLWSDGPSLMPLPGERLDEILSQLRDRLA
jgi:ATP-dependent helicase/nuclease subunit A